MNETFKKFEALINLSSNSEKKEQCINNIINIFEKILDSDASIKSRKKSFEERSEISNET